VVDESLRRRTGRDSQGPVARLAFNPDPFLEKVGERRVFSPRPDLALMHLSHPMLQKAIGSLTRLRFPGTGDEVSRWTVRRGEIPAGAEALLLLHLEELGVNDLREAFHHWIRTVVFPFRKGSLGEPLPHCTARDLRGAEAAIDPAYLTLARDLLAEVEPDLKNFLRVHAESLTADLRRELEAEGVRARKREDERYRSREAEVSILITETTLAKLEREVEALRKEQRQGTLFDEAGRLDTIERSIEEKQEEIARRTRHHQEVREQLAAERERIQQHILPRRHTLSGSAQVFPVTIEVRLP
jgi:hypothetical protein